MCWTRFGKHFERLIRGWLEEAIGILENILIDLGGKTLLEIFVKDEKIGWLLFLSPKSTTKILFCLKRVVWGWLEDAIGVFEYIIFDLGGEPLIEIFVK